MRVRKAAVANFFYPGDPLNLKKMLEQLLGQPGSPRRALGLICPHAGYVYSGSAAATVYRSAQLTKRFIILGPNHTGMGAPLSIYARGAWETPLGKVDIDEDLANSLIRLCPVLEDDIHAHLREHSIEVQIPFLQFILNDFTFVPVCVGTSRWNDLESLADAIVQALKDASEPIQLIASTDMSHYIPAANAEKLDRLAFEAIQSLDARGLYDTVHQHHLSMCGYLPTTILLKAAKELGAEKAELLVYTHSGKVTGDDQSVVSYAGFLVS